MNKISGARPAHPAPPERLGAIVAALVALGVLVIGYTVHAQLPANAVQLPYEANASTSIRLFLPQGWAFFTRSPRLADVVPYVRTDGQWRLALQTPNAEPHNVFGLSRRARAQGVELGVLVGEVPAAGWQPCAGTPVSCLDLASSVPAHNTSLIPSLCGDIGLVQQTPLPWAWSGASDQTTMPSMVARVEASC